MHTVDLLILALLILDRTVCFTKLWSQISHLNRILSTVPLIYNLNNRLKLTLNAPKKARKNI
jgi:hypothetical protein